MGRLPLPIDPLLPDLVAALDRTRCVVLQAPPGAGKTTRVPMAVLAGTPGEVIVLEPRRLAARLAARYVAQEHGEDVGGLIGYQVRFDERVGPRTRVRFVTEGILARRMVAEPDLPGVGAVVLDEFHERHLQSELALVLLRRLQRGPRPDLRMVVMSATLDSAGVAAFLGCPVLMAEGRRFPVTIEHADRQDDRPLAALVATAVSRLAKDTGDVLVFLPGAAEIGAAARACAPGAERAKLRLVTLHGDMAPDEQDRAVRPGPERKVILATNVAETSLTIEGVAQVVDSGLARVARHSPWTGLPSLRVQKISQASAAQRAGRAGRTREGRCLRLYTKHDHDSRPAEEAPEIRRLDLAELMLQLHAAGIAQPDCLEWLEAPPGAAVRAAEMLLGRLGAVDSGGGLTSLGRRMLRFPTHPRLARLLVEAEARGVAADAAVVAAWIAEGEDKRHDKPAASGASDLTAALEAFHAEPWAFPAIDRAQRQLLRASQRSARLARDPDDALGLCVLAAFPDRVARRRRPGAPELLLASGGAAELSARSVVKDAEFLVAVDVEERRSQAASARVVVRMASAILPEWLLDLFPEALAETAELVFNATAERVEAVRRLTFDGLVLDERRSPPGPAEAEQASLILAQAVSAAGLERFVAKEDLDRFLNRLAFLKRTVPEIDLASPDPGAILASLCRGCSSFAELRAELRQTDLLAAFRAALGPGHTRLLRELAPEKVTLPSGRSAVVHYEPDRPPWMASRLQDFFGLRVGPTIGAGKVPLVLHLLAPNQRAVQVTTDLVGFWQRHYPAIRRELRRRYPKHAWPEDPTRPVDLPRRTGHDGAK